MDSPSVHTQITTAVPIRVLSLKLSLGILNAKPIINPKRAFDTTRRGIGSPPVGIMKVPITSVAKHTVMPPIGPITKADNIQGIYTMVILEPPNVSTCPNNLKASDAATSVARYVIRLVGLSRFFAVPYSAFVFTVAISCELLSMSGNLLLSCYV